MPRGWRYGQGCRSSCSCSRSICWETDCATRSTRASASRFSIRLDVEAIPRQQLRMQLVPIHAVHAAAMPEGIDHAGLHALEATDIDVAVLVREHPNDDLAPLANEVLHIRLAFARHAREGEIDVDEVLRQLHQRTEIRKL